MKLNRSLVANSMSDPMPAPPSPGDVAAAVRRHAALQFGERQIAQLQQRRQELRDRQKWLTVEHYSDLDVVGREINGLAKEAESLEMEISTIHIALAPQMRAHAAAVDAALASIRKPTAERAIAAFTELRAALGVLAECDSAVASVGGEIGGLHVLMAFGLMSGLANAENVVRNIAESSSS
jgi:hypothetical protein